MSDYIIEMRDHLIRKNYQPEWMIGIKIFEELPRLVDMDRDVMQRNDGRKEFFDQFDHVIKMQSRDDDEDISATIWLIENLKGPWCSTTVGEFYFIEDADALRFKMVWG